MESRPNSDIKALQREGEAVAGFLTQALLQEAIERGGMQFATEIAILSVSDSEWPSDAAIWQLERMYPGSAASTFDRAHALQLAANQAEIEASNKPQPRRFGRAILDAFHSFSLFKK